jgi:hypothetical protein
VKLWFYIEQSACQCFIKNVKKDNLQKKQHKKDSTITGSKDPQLDQG